MDEDDPWFRQPWEDADPPPRQTSGGPPPATRRCSFRWPGRRTPSPGSRPPSRPLRTTVAAGLRARLALFEAAGFLAHCGPAVHPHDLALRDANLTGSYTLAALTGRLREAAPWSDSGRRRRGGAADDHLVAHALAYARHWRRLAELATVRPLQSVESLAAPLAQLGAPLADDAPTRAWLAALPGPDARVRACSPPPGSWRPGCPGCRGATGSRSARPTSPPRCGAGTVTAGAARCRSGRRRCRGSTRWRGKGEGSSSLAISTASPRRRGAAAANSTACRRRRAGSPRCRASARSRLQAAGAVALREPLVTGRLLARRLDVSTRAGLDLAPGWSRPACCAR